MPLRLRERYAQVVGFLEPNPTIETETYDAVAECNEESIDICISAYRFRKFGWGLFANVT